MHSTFIDRTDLALFIATGVTAARDVGGKLHKVLRLRGKGIPNVHGYGRGDQLVRVIVETPTKLNDEQRKLLEKFAESGGEKIHPLAKSFLEKAKKLFWK